MPFASLAAHDNGGLRYNMAVDEDAADRTNAARLILAFKIALQHQSVSAQHHEPVLVPDALVGHRFV